ncbi:MAG: InlB B-repeat-containing protein [Candidatus Aenigmatarchaeota archaeon]
MNKKLLCFIGTVLVSAMLLLSVLTVAVGRASSMDSDDEEDDEGEEDGFNSELAQPTHTLTLNSTSGGNVIEPGEGTFTYEAGAEVELVAQADPDYHFVEWRGDTETIGDTGAEETTVTMEGNYSIIAVFAVDRYELSISSTAGGSVVEPGEGTFTYNLGEVVNLEAVADPGYHFVQWTGDTGTIADTDSNLTTITMEEEYEIEAEFAVTDYTLTINSTVGGNVTYPGEGTFGYEEGFEEDLVAQPDPFHHFVEWRGDTGTIADTGDEETTITMEGDYNITAVFAVYPYELFIESTAGGEVVEPGEGTFTYNGSDVVDLEAVADPGYHFVRWEGDIETIADIDSNLTTITIEEEYEIEAEFAVTHYNLTINSTVGGTVTDPGEGTFGYEEGFDEDLVAEADPLYHFVEWRGDTVEIGDTTEAETTITMEDDYNITAVFAQDPYTLTISSTGGGNVTEPGEDTFGYQAGIDVNLVAQPDPNYHFVEWRGDNDTIGDTEAEETTITMEGNYTITAVFAIDTYQLTIDSMAGGSVIEPGEDTFTYNVGEVVNLEAVAETDYQFAQWAGDTWTVVDLESDSTTLTMEDDYAITAVFAPRDYYLTISSTSGGDVIEPGEGTFTYEGGTEVELIAQADPDYHFVEWRGDTGTIGDTEAEETTITMEGNYTITAVFAVDRYELTISSTAGGSVIEPGEGAFTYTVGEVVDLEAIADPGYHFVRWEGDIDTIGDRNSNLTTITMEDEYEIEAEFAVTDYTLTINSTVGGNVTYPGEGTFGYEEGFEEDLVAQPDPFHHFVEWRGDTGTIADTGDEETTITMEGDYNITAVFAVYPYELFIESTAGGEVVEPGEGTFTYNGSDVVDLEAVADPGYHFVRWEGDIETIADIDSNLTTITIEEEYEIEAEFAVTHYNLTINSTVGGTVTDPGEGTFGYEEGFDEDLVAEADPLYHFVEWRGDTVEIGDTTEAETTITMEDDYNITAVFAQDPYTLTISSTGGGNVTEPGEDTFGYQAGIDVNLVAQPDPNYHFVEWRGDNDTIGDTEAEETTITMEGNYTITAVFAIDTYQLTIDSMAGGSVIEPGEDTFTYNVGEVVNLEAVAETDYQFAQWAGDTWTVVDPESDSTTLTIEDDYSITAVFAPVDYYLTISSTSGGDVIEPGEGTFGYEEGAEQNLVAQADPDYHFVEWTGDNDTIGDPEAEESAITMEGNYSITAVFAINRYDLTVDSAAEGSVVEPGEGTFTYNANEVVDLEAVADPGYHFVEWTGDTETIADRGSNETTITMEEEYEITAEFASTDYNLTISSTVGGSVIEPGEGIFGYEEGAEQNLVAQADTDYYFVEWTGDTETIGDTEAEETTITMEGNYTITAEFAPSSSPGNYTLAISSTSGGEVIDPGEGNFEYEAGEEVIIRAGSSRGYHFVRWTGDNETIIDPESADTSITMEGDYTITAEFAVEIYELTIVSSSGGEVIEPGEGNFEFESGAEVNLEAVADSGYHFVEWAGDTGMIGDTEAEETTITMEGDYTILAEFSTSEPVMIEITSPQDGVLLSESDVTLEWDSENVEYHEIRIDDGNWIDVGTDITYTFNDVEDGEHTVEVRGVNENITSSASGVNLFGAGGQAVEDVSFTVDTTPPDVNIITPEDEETFDVDSIRSEWTGSDEVSGIDYYEVKLDDGDWEEEDVDITLSNLEEGDHTIQVRAVDHAGNVGEDSVSFEVTESEEEGGGLPLGMNWIYGLLALLLALVIAILLMFAWYRKEIGVIVTAPEDKEEGDSGLYTYEFTVENSGDDDETYDLEVDSSNADWTPTVSEEIFVSEGASETVEVEVTIPEDAEDGEFTEIDLIATSQTDEEVFDSDTMRIDYEGVEEEQEEENE